RPRCQKARRPFGHLRTIPYIYKSRERKYLMDSIVRSPGARWREVMVAEQPLQIVGASNSNHALLATQAGFRAIYLSGGGVSAGSLGVPDLGIISLQDVLVDVDRIVNVCDTPIMVDVDTGFGPSAFNVARTVKSLIRAGA